MNVRPKLSLGMDISHSQISLALMAGDSQGVHLLRGVQATLPTDVIKDGRIQDGAKLAQILTSLRSEIKSKTPGILALWGSAVVNQIIELPSRLPANVSEFISNELKQCVTLSVENTVSGYGPILDGPQGRHRVLAMATDQRRVLELIGHCRQARLRTQAAEPAMLAFLRAVYQSRVANRLDQNVMILWVRDNTLHLCVFRKGQIDLLRSHSLSWDQDDPSEFSQQLSEEIDATLQYYDIEVLEEAGHWQISVVVPPTLALPEGLLTLLESSQPDARFELVGEDQLESLVPWVDKKTGPTSIVAIGLALRSLERKANLPSINLLPARILQMRVLQRQAVLTALSALLGIVLMALVVGGLSWHADVKRQAIEEYMAHHDMDEAAALIDRQAKLEEQVDTLSQNYQVMHQLIRKHKDIDWAALLRDIGSRASKKLQITRMENRRDEAVLFLEGISLTYNAIPAFVQRLAESNHIQDVQIAKTEQIRAGSDQAVRYWLRCQLQESSGLMPCLPTDL